MYILKMTDFDETGRLVMRLVIDDCAKIDHADILIDGITVIAGQNNTGKSTVGKILFSIFNAMDDIDAKILEERKREIQDACRMNLKEYAFGSEAGTSLSRKSDRIARRIIKEINSLPSEKRSKSIMHSIIVSAFDDVFSDGIKGIPDFENVINRISDEVESIFGIFEKAIIKEVLTRYFGKVFSSQINSLQNKDSHSTLRLEIKDKEIVLEFKDNECIGYQSNVSIMHKAIYIDNSFILDSLNRYAELNMMDRHLRTLLSDDANHGVMDGIIGSVIAKEKLGEINTVLGQIVDGSILREKNDEYYLNDDGLQEPIAFNNLSTGLKSFVLIKMLLEKGIIKNKDVLILDEPEIHLHPEWQVAYAELIVLIQRYFDLSVVIATHSPYFVDAINLFSIKYGTDSKVNYYLSSIKENGARMENVTDDIEKIYRKMASPIQLLDTLRYEINNR